MASLGFSIRSAARATFYAYRRVPVRWRLGGGSAALTFVILAGVAGVVGVLTDRQINSEFSSNITLAAQTLQKAMDPHYSAVTGTLNCGREVGLTDYARADSSQIRVFNQTGKLLCTQADSYVKGVSSNQVPVGVPKFNAPMRRASSARTGTGCGCCRSRGTNTALVGCSTRGRLPASPIPPAG